MPRAIVTLTCPWCGGRVDGIESVDVPQRIPCPYCRTDLHVPHVGDRVIIREVQAIPEPQPLAATGDGKALATVASLIFIIIGLFTVRMMTSSSPATAEPRGPSVFEQHQQCERSCTDGCGPKPPDPFADRRDYDPIDMGAIDRDVAWMKCSGECTLSCYR